MSKSEWKELPDAKSLEDYMFLNEEPNEVWAWEGLRRNPAYRQDWRDREFLATQKHYNPPKRDDESEFQWMGRVSLTDNPVTVRLDFHRARTWGLRALCDPERPFSTEVRFIQPWSDFPRLLELPDDFYALIVDDETEHRLIRRIGDRWGVIAYDLEKPIGDQALEANRILLAKKTQMISLAKIESKGHGNKPDIWVRHLRVMDGLRQDKPMKRAELALALESKKNKGLKPEELKRQGDKLVEAAHQFIESGYYMALLSKKPGKVSLPT